MDDRLSTLQKLAALKGPPLSIMMALLIAQRPLQATELESFTGYGNQAITRGLRTLRHYRAIVSLGRLRGFTLTPFWRQMMLPMPEIDHENHDLEQIDHENHDLEQIDHENHDLPIYGSGYGGGSISTGSNHHPSNQAAGANHDFGENTPKSVENTTGESTPGGEITARSATPAVAAVARWLNQAGVDAGSFHWEKIIALDLDPGYVQAHVLELLAAEAGIPGADNIGTGALIYRLEHGWQAPPLRCAACLRVARDCRCNGRDLRQHIPAELRDVIRR